MPRLPDIPINDWRQDLQERFQKQTEGLFPSLEFELGARDAESQIPPDYDAVGGRDQWEEAERQRMAEEFRRQQQEAEEQRRQEERTRQEQIAAQAEEYRRMQAESQANAQAQQQEQERSVMDMIRGLGIPTPSDAFSEFEPQSDSTTTSGALDISQPLPPSDLEQFNQFAGGLNQETFGPPPQTEPEPDHSSSTGIFDQIGSAASRAWEASAPPSLRPGTSEYEAFERNRARFEEGPVGDVGRAWNEANRYGKAVNETLMGSGLGLAGRFVSELAGEPTIETYAPAVRDIPVFGEDIGTATATELAAPMLPLPGRAGKLVDALSGVEASKAVGAISDATVNSIKHLLSLGLEDEALAVERKLAENSPNTLEEIQKLTRGIEAPSEIPGGALTDEERALNAAADERARTAPPHSGYLEDPEFGAELPNAPREPSPTPYTRGIASDVETVAPASPYNRGATPEEARQLQIPGFEDSVVRGATDERRPYTNLPGFGTLPESTVRGAEGAMPREVEDEIARTLRETVFDQTPLTGEERRARLAELWKVDPNRIHGWFDESTTVDPRMAGVKQEALKNRVRELGDQWDNARIEFGRVKAEIDTVQAAGNKVGDDLAQEAAYWGTEFARTNLELRNAVLGQKLGASAAAQALNAQRGGRLGAYVLSEARRLDDVANAAGEAAQVAKRVARKASGEVTPEDEAALKKLADKLGSERTVRAVTRGKAGQEVDKLAQTGGGGRGRGTGTAPTGPREPRRPADETLAERLGRLQQEERELVLFGGDRAAVRSQIEDLLAQVSERARESIRARQTGRATTQALTAAEEERAINEALGRRAMAQVRSTINKQEDRTLLGRTAEDLTKRVDQAVRRFVSEDPEKLQQAIDRQFQRRIDGALASEQRATERAALREQAQAAAGIANQIRRNPNQIAQYEEEFDLLLRRMRERSNAGEKVANELEERLWSNLGKDLTRREAQEYQAGQRAISEARIRAVKTQLQQVLDNPRMPDRHLRIAELYKDLAEISDTGKKLASGMREKAWTRGIQKSGLFAEDADSSRLVEMMGNIDPKDPTSLRPILEVMVRPSLWQVAREISFINLLSSPVTHFTNITSTISNGLLRLMLRNPIEWAASGGRSSGKGAAFEGLVRSLPEGARLAAKTEISGYNPRRLESALATGDYRHIGREVVPLAMAKYGMGKVGEAWHMMSTRPLEAMDALMGHAMFTSSVYELAQKEADDLIRAGRQGIDRVRLRDEIINNIWDHEDIIKKAGKIEDYTLFRSRESGPFESKLRMLMGIKEVDPDAPAWQKGLAALADFIMPFWNVPYNFTKQGVQNVFGAIIEPPKAVAAYARGDVEQGAEHVAKAMQGLGMIGIPILLAQDDNLTGRGPEDPGDRRVWSADHRPYSWRVPGSRYWVSYEGTPWAVPFATVAGAKEALEFQKKDPEAGDLERAAGVGIGAVGGGIRGALSQSFVEAAMRNFEALTGEISGPQAGANMLASTALRYSPHILAGVPPSAMLNFLGTMVDTVERDAGRAHNLRDIPEVATNIAKSRLPILRGELEPRRDAYGEPIRNERQGLAAFLPRSMSGQTTPRPNDPITQNLEALSVGVPTVPESITVNNVDVPLTIREQQRFQELYGIEYRKKLEKIEADKEKTGRTYDADFYERLRGNARDLAQSKLRQEIGTETFVQRIKRARSQTSVKERR